MPTKAGPAWPTALLRVAARALAAASGPLPPSVRWLCQLVGLLAGLLPCPPAAFGVEAAVAGVSVDFEVDMRAEIAAGRFDAERDGVTLRGGVEPLAWQRGLALRAIGAVGAPGAPGAGRYAIRVHFPRPPFGGQALLHKFRIERAGQGDDEGWEPGSNHAAVLSAEAPRVARVFGALAVASVPRISGSLLTLDTVPSRHISPRPVQVWLPPGYERDGARRYPVLYLHDGQNLFDDRAAGAEWQVDETAQRLVLAGAVAPMIIVGVPSGRDRLFELTPTAMLMPGERRGQGPAGRRGGGAPAYARFLIDELKPMIDERFRTQPGAASTAVGGSSLGGLVSLWLALHHGDTFGAALVVSPSLWWDDGLALREVRAAKAPATRPGARPRLWLDIGAHEGDGAVPAARALRDALQAAGWGGGALAYTEDPDGRHDELSWAARFEGMLRFLYPATPANAPH